MKRVFIIFSILCCCTIANAQNPFEAYGYTPKIATLSNGKYNEFHDLDTIVQIGTVLFNTQTKQIVAFLQVDTLYSEATLQPDIVSMWMSPDPLASEYPSNSPYMYCLGNPIVFVDPDGRFVDWYKSEAGNVIWQPGSADKINVGGEEFRNIGTTYTKNQMGNNYHYVQDNLVGITNNNTSFGEYLQNDKAYKNAISVANTQSNQNVKDVYMARFNQGLSEAHAGTLQLMGSIIGAVLTVETAVSIYIGVEGLMAVGGSTIGKNSVKLVEAGEYTITKTVANNLSTRPYLNSPSTICNILKTGKGIPDEFFKGGVNFKVPGSFNGSKGIFELGINQETNTIYHFLFKTIK